MSIHSIHKNTNLVNAKLAEHGVSPRRESNCVSGQPEVLSADVLCYMSPPTLALASQQPLARRRKLRRRSTPPRAMPMLSLSSIVRKVNQVALLAQSKASEESEDKNDDEKQVISVLFGF